MNGLGGVGGWGRKGEYRLGQHRMWQGPSLDSFFADIYCETMARRRRISGRSRARQPGIPSFGNVPHA